jgi:RNA polymerase sigma-70 factor, ECF subfamily
MGSERRPVTSVVVERLRDTRSRSESQRVSPDLVESCKKGDEVAWAQLVEATYREVYALCLRILNDPEDAADATQDAYMKAWRGLAGYRGDALFSTWLYRVASNAALSRLRGRMRQRSHETQVEDDVLGRVAGSSSTQASALVNLDLQELDKGLRSLPDHYRSAVVLRDIYGLSIEEIARQLKISETAAKVRVHRARKKLKHMMFEDGDE